MLKPMLKELSMRESRERIGGMQRSNIRYRNLASLADRRRDIREARRDAPIATTLAVGDVGLSALMAKETRKQADIERESTEAQLEYLKLLKAAIEKYPLDIIRRWNASQTSVEPEPMMTETIPRRY